MDQFIGSAQDLKLQANFLFFVEGFLHKFCPEICSNLNIKETKTNS